MFHSYSILSLYVRFRRKDKNTGENDNLSIEWHVRSPSLNSDNKILYYRICKEIRLFALRETWIKSNKNETECNV